MFAVNNAYIEDDATWYKMTYDELQSVNEFECSDTLKDAIKTFLKEKMDKGYLFTEDMLCTEAGYDGFEHFIAYKKSDESAKIKKWYEFSHEEFYNLNDLFGDTNNDFVDNNFIDNKNNKEIKVINI
ncbi:MAG: hypothetical protein CMF62_03110 [Magnetococcales bacterium]|nr:hypothetical protein [Magnetococcales bacterium]|tara:strand:+ start:31090 stop:31470 length:381 start_codon:yes stop_codon:yes gene_type:complete